MNEPNEPNDREDSQNKFDYIIVGSGAGGGPLAARLAQAGKRVLVIEAGANHTKQGNHAPGNEISRVPILHAQSSEHPDLAWRFFVDHYQAKENGQLPDGIPVDPKRHSDVGNDEVSRQRNGIFYPRAAGIGGCTIHNAMITIAGPDSDWDDVASFLGDPSWSGRAMRGYFRKLERNDYLDIPDRRRQSNLWQTLTYVHNSLRFLRGRNVDSTSGKHGFDGWLHTSLTDLSIGLADKQLVAMLLAALRVAKRHKLDNAWTFVSRFLRGEFVETLDPNHSETQANSPEGIVMIPLSVHGQRTTIHQNAATPYAMLGLRSSPREFLLETQANHPGNLTIWTDCLVTEVLFDSQQDSDGESKVKPRAIGVKYMRGPNLYRAHMEPHAGSDPVVQEVQVVSGGEVVLCGGSFNTPQLLMLSGIGDKRHLEELSIPCRVDLAGVGRNLQDRYEVSVVSEMKDDFKLLEGATFKIPNEGKDADPHLQRWREEGTGLYTSNGAVLGIFKRSQPELAQPDLFIFGVPGDFRGYKVGYSENPPHNRFSWIILKSHTSNRDGIVKLRSRNPRDTPLINFHYFGTGAPGNQHSSLDPDIPALQHGVGFVREIAQTGRHVVSRELHPGQDADINQWIRSEAWGHHACGTCRMGPAGDPLAVLDSRFRVKGIDGLRVVDASIFPKIPGYFIVTNLYMASEKAADVILEDAESRRHFPATYPHELFVQEAAAVGTRRQVLHGGIAPTPADHIQSDEHWAPNVTGLALSGGGIRSATFALGLLQSLANYKLLRRIDFMSTVSGGGYIGTFLGRLYNRHRDDDRSRLNRRSGADEVEGELVNPESPMIDWLRSHGNYIAPAGTADGRSNVAIYLRNWLSVQFLIGVALFAVFGIACAIRYGLFETALVSSGLLLGRERFPIGHILSNLLGPWYSPWMIVAEILIFFLAFPRILAYWIVSPNKHESFKTLPLLTLMAVAIVNLWLGVRDGLVPEYVIVGLGMLTALIHVELVWHRGYKRERAMGASTGAVQRARTLNYLTYDLGFAIALVGMALTFTFVDSIAFALREWLIAGNIQYATAFGSFFAGITASIPIIRWLAGLFRDQEKRRPTFFDRNFKRQGLAAALAIGISLPILIIYCFAAHAAYQSGNALVTGLLLTAFASLLTIVFAFPTAVSFVNRSSLSQAYAARLARAYLGASNPERQRPDGKNVTEVIAGDDVASLRDYQPYRAAGPFHIINVIINQTVDSASRLKKRDRKGLSLAVSSVGLSVGDHSHCLWSSPSSAAANNLQSVVGVTPVGRTMGEDHPLVDELNLPADRVESLSLRQWMAISGAAIDPGQGRTTHMGTALLMGIANLRTGYWWDTGIAESSRTGFPKLSLLRRVLYLIPRFFATQALLCAEWLAWYPGPWQRFWHLGDGGYFENLGAYELIRRQIPRIIICDTGADPNYDLTCLAELIRKVRIDFGAELVPFTPLELERMVPAEMRPFVGILDDLQFHATDDGTDPRHVRKHAALLWVKYKHTDIRSVVLYIKASVTGDEPEDILGYQASSPEFPHEPTEDQFFDEAQWESYRALGRHASSSLFRTAWFWELPLLSTDDNPPPPSPPAPQPAEEPSYA